MGSISQVSQFSQGQNTREAFKIYIHLFNSSALLSYSYVRHGSFLLMVCYWVIYQLTEDKNQSKPSLRPLSPNMIGPPPPQNHLPFLTTVFPHSHSFVPSLVSSETVDRLLFLSLVLSAHSYPFSVHHQIDIPEDPCFTFSLRAYDQLNTIYVLLMIFTKCVFPIKQWTW
jgi:hypothetical protein